MSIDRNGLDIYYRSTIVNAESSCVRFIVHASLLLQPISVHAVHFKHGSFPHVHAPQSPVPSPSNARSISGCRGLKSISTFGSQISSVPYSHCLGRPCCLLNFQSYLRSRWTRRILTSCAAKNRPGQTCTPCPKPKCSGLVDTNWWWLSCPRSRRLL